MKGADDADARKQDYEDEDNEQPNRIHIPSLSAERACARKPNLPWRVDLDLPHQNQSGTVPIKVVVFLQRNEARRSIKGARPRVRLVVE
jgi:hypothetical protein